eukprot:5413862-Pyramimonas_sp.AAC.1
MSRKLFKRNINVSFDPSLVGLLTHAGYMRVGSFRGWSIMQSDMFAWKRTIDNIVVVALVDI